MADATFRCALTTNAPSQSPAFTDIAQDRNEFIFRSPLGEWFRCVDDRKRGMVDYYVSSHWGKGPATWGWRAHVFGGIEKGTTPMATVYQWFWLGGGTL